MQRQHFRLLAGPEEDGSRLDQFLAAHAGDLSRTVLRRVIEIGGVHVGGRRVRRCSQPVRVGEAVEVYIDGLPLTPWRLAEGDLLFRDRWLIAIAKPAGIETQPTPARYQGTLYEALLTFLKDPFRPLDAPPLGMVQRLDRDTSGVIVFSIHPKAHRGLTEALAGGAARKQYLALVTGEPREGAGEIRSLLARSRGSNLVKSVARGGKEAITRFRVVDRFGDAALVEVEILTGRSHQIRAHMAELGHPLVGDCRYGGAPMLRGMAVSRQMLHAARIELRHPVTGKPLRIEAPLPADLASLLQRLGCILPAGEE